MESHSLGSAVYGSANLSQEQAMASMGYSDYGHSDVHMGLCGGGGTNGVLDKAPPTPSVSGALPEQHEDQMALGFKMIQNAYDARVQNLERELSSLRLGCEEQKNQAMNLHKKNSGMESKLVEGHQRAQQLSDENKELFKTVQALRKQLERLEGLKKRVVDTLAEESHADYSSDGHEASLAMRDDYLQSSLPLTMGSIYGEKQQPRSPAAAASWAGGGGGGAGPAMPGAGMPMMPGTASSSRAPSPPPQRTIAPGTSVGVGGVGAQPLPSAGGTAAVGSGGDGTAVDGKQFFRQARSQLSYEAFNEFLDAIKRLNNQQSTREDTLEQAHRIFGPELAGLYQDFEQLLSRQSA